MMPGHETKIRCKILREKKPFIFPVEEKMEGIWVGKVQIFNFNIFALVCASASVSYIAVCPIS